jgi:hypothetical protein
MNATPGPAPLEPSLERYVLQAEEDLARRTGIAIDQITVLEVQPVTWPDGGLGCPQPGMAYIQVTVDGLLIRLHAGGRDYEYHSGGTRAPFLCQK